jgi:hypothetical protein
MFSLFITITAILLVALLAFIAVYYGGPAYNNAHLNAQVATLMSQGAQVKTAANAYAADNGGTVPADMPTLTDASGPAGSYLTAVPANPLAPSGAVAPWNITSSSGSVVAYTAIQGICACEKFNAKYDATLAAVAADCANDTAAENIPSCSGLASASPVCCK